MDVSEAKRLKQLEEENAKLKRIVADQALDITILKDLLKREGVSVWHGRVHRITKELRLQVPRRKRKRLACSKPAQQRLRAQINAGAWTS